MMKVFRKKGSTRLTFFSKKFGGFTLIELLVVIAVISLLASIVLVSLSGARSRAKDGRIIAEMGQIRTAVEIYRSYQTPETYAGSPSLATVCTAATCTYSPGTPERDICTLCADIFAQNGVAKPTFQATTNEYCASVVLASSASKWYCIDEGRGVETTTDPKTAACTATSFNCP